VIRVTYLAALTERHGTFRSVPSPLAAWGEHNRRAPATSREMPKGSNAPLAGKRLINAGEKS
jgi:hypothetical protein